MVKTLLKRRAHVASKKPSHASSRLALMNGAEPRAATLLKTLKRVTRETTSSRSRRHLYVITCYFDLEALQKLATSIQKTIEAGGGIFTGITVAMDVGEWIRCRRSEDDIAHEIAAAAGLPRSLVWVIPAQFPGRLLHAKAYAAIRPGEGKVKKGFVVVTSGNATGPGLGLRENSNMELASVLTDPDSLVAFEGVMKQLAAHKVSPSDALKQDEYLTALALFSRGSFYHKWQGSLGTEVRLKLTLTEKGKERQRDQATFKNYAIDADTMSTDPLNIQGIFKHVPKPFPEAFWRIYGVDTLLGYWLPESVAALANEVLEQKVKPYLDQIKKQTSPNLVTQQCNSREAEVKTWSSRGWIKEDVTVLERWSERVELFRTNMNVLKTRLHPFEKLPDEVLVGESRATVRRTFELLRDQLLAKTLPRGTKAVLKDFIARSPMLDEFDEELARLAEAARTDLEKHKSKPRPRTRGG